MRWWRSTGGQATSEYVALVALVAIVLALASGLTAGGVGGQVLAGIQRGLCRLTDAACVRTAPPADELAPCPVERSRRMEELTATIASLRLGTIGTLDAVRTSDGRVTVTLAHGGTAAGGGGLGARVRLGRKTLGGGLRGSAGVSWTSGRAWRFPDEASARAFISAFGAKATIGGRLVDGVRSRCSVVCDAIGWRPHPELPGADEVFSESGPVTALTASLGAGAGIGARAQALLGRRWRRDGSRTWYLRLDATATADLQLPAALGAGAGGDAVLGYEVDADGRPRSLTLSLVGQLEGQAAASHAAGPARAALAVGGGVLLELDATLDLREPATRDAAVALLQALTDRTKLALVPRRVRALGREIVRHAQLDRRTFAMLRTSSGIAAGVARGAELDAGFEQAASGMRLLSAETRLPGLPFLPRDDCRPA